MAIGGGAGVGLLGGLLGLGGAEFRLPVLVGVLGYALRRAVVLNLAMSLVTVVSAAASRVSLSSMEGQVIGFLPVAMAMMSAAVLGAYVSTAWFASVSEGQLHRAIRTLLLGIGVVLLVEAAVSWRGAEQTMGPLGQVVIGLTAGGVIGAVSSLLGVAGGELIIPTLVFAVGVGIKEAGTLSLVISLPTILTGLWRHRRHGLALRREDLLELVIPMGSGTLVGAVLGGALVPYVPAAAVKAVLGAALIASALKVLGRGSRPGART